jgi:acyl-CoA reductase-like NAD-dependent aldehyde dehydrogenase
MPTAGAFSGKELRISVQSAQDFRDMSSETVDQALVVLVAHKDTWVSLDISERIDILDELVVDLLKVAERWIAVSVGAKETQANPMGEAEEWVLFATALRNLRVLRRSLEDIQKYGRPTISGKVFKHANGQVVAQVFPGNLFDKLMFSGVTSEVWMEPGITAEESIRAQASIYHDKNHRGRVVLVLGAGNASMLQVVDFLHKLFIEGSVVILKPNPINAYLIPLIEEGFQALIKRGFLQVVYGGTEIGSYLCSHPAVNEIHMTGSDKTFESIVFGHTINEAERQSKIKPLITKRFTSELGNISPVIIVPGPWSERDIREQAVNLSTWLVVNAGFGCLTPRIIIQHEGWVHRQAFIKAIGDVLERVETRKAYYPGARERHRAFIAEHPDALQFGDGSNDRLPWTFITDVDPENKDEICFRREAFCSLFAETAIKAISPVDFLERVVEFANHKLWGSLTVTLIVHHDSLKDPLLVKGVQNAIENLRYGTIAINLFPYYSYYFMVAPWGAFPGHDIYDIQSGTGKVANMLMFERPQKSVVRAPFKKLIDPLLVSNKRPDRFARTLAYFEASPSLWKVPRLLWTALLK